MVDIFQLNFVTDMTTLVINQIKYQPSLINALVFFFFLNRVLPLRQSAAVLFFLLLEYFFNFISFSTNSYSTLPTITNDTHSSSFDSIFNSVRLEIFCLKTTN